MAAKKNVTLKVQSSLNNSGQIIVLSLKTAMTVKFQQSMIRGRSDLIKKNQAHSEVKHCRKITSV